MFGVNSHTVDINLLVTPPDTLRGEQKCHKRKK